MGESENNSSDKVNISDTHEPNTQDPKPTTGRCQRCDKVRPYEVYPFCEDCWEYLNKHE